MTPEITLLLGSIIGGTGALLSYWAGWRARGACRPPRGTYGPRSTRPVNPFVSELQQQINDALDGYRSINYPDPSPDRRPTNPYSGEPVALTESSVQRGNGNGGPTTPKPEITPRGQWPGGYQPRPSRPGANPPPSEP